MAWRTGSQTNAKLALATAAALVGAATWLELAGRQRAAGGAALAAAVLSVYAAVRARAQGPGLLSFLDSAVDRAFDGSVLSAILITMRNGDRPEAVAAAVAVIASFLAAYVRARGNGLGYEVDESPVYRAVRMGLVAGGLLSGRPTAFLIAVAALSSFVFASRSAMVAKQELA